VTIGLGRDGHGVLRWVRHGLYLYWCPGCNTGHTFDVTELNADGARVGWDGDHLKPTVEPAMKFEGCEHVIRCGVIHYFQNCKHGMAGQSVLMPDYPR
jgi:hypothetical protein